MKKLTKIIILFLLCSCSLLSKDNLTDNPEVRSLLLNLSTNYLGGIINGDLEQINDLVFWEDYIHNKDNSISKQTFVKQLSKLDGRYLVKNHPLLNLKPEEFDIDNNNARITFVKKDFKDIELHFKWVDSAWLIVDDNLFGEDGIFSDLKKLSNEQKAEVGKVRQIKLKKLSNVAL